MVCFKPLYYAQLCHNIINSLIYSYNNVLRLRNKKLKDFEQKNHEKVIS